MKKYEEVEAFFKNQILNGLLKPGDKLPDLEALCNQFQVSHITIQKAFKNLLTDGYITRIKCKGTFVSERSRSKENQKVLAMIISVIERNDSSLLNIIKGAQSAAEKIGCSFMVEITDGSMEKERQAIENLINKDISGLLLYLNNENLAYQLLDSPSFQKISYVMLDHYDAIHPCNSITANNIDGGFLATEYLINHGHKKIVFVSSQNKRNTERDRYTGYCNALEVYGISSDYELFDESEPMMNRLYEGIKNNDITAAFAVNDHVAMLLLKFLFTYNIRVPEDFSIVGFDDSFEANYALVPLTTVRQDFAEIGAVALELLYETIQKQDDRMLYKKVFLPVKVIERNSVKSI